MVMVETKRRRLNHGLEEEEEEADTSMTTPPGAEIEPKDWNGFCEIESEPALFNAMLRDFGVKGVRVQEVVSLDEEMMAFLQYGASSKPVYGLIFLFRWQEDDPGKQEASCPEGIWFANQTAENACASVALLNIVNNIEGVELGENLQRFKDFTMSFTPALRGDAINNFEYIKRIHNSFARKMDMLNSDLQLKNEAASRRSRQNKQGRDDYETDAGFHFIAFVPALGKVWKFDGLERQPQALGDCPEDDWLDLAKPDILTRMNEYEEDQIEFSILSLVKDPLPGLVDRLAANVKHLQAVNERTTALKEEGKPDSETGVADSLNENTIWGSDPSYCLTQEKLDNTELPANPREMYQTCSADETNQHRQHLSDEQRDLRATIRDEQQTQQADEDYATGRRYDYVPAVRTWMQFLAQKKAIEGLV